MSSVSVCFNKLRKRIKVNDNGFHRVDDVAYHLLCGQVLNKNAILELLNMPDDEFLECLENANNILDL